MRRALADGVFGLSTAVALLLAGCAPELGPAPQLRTTPSLASSQTFSGPTQAWPSDAWWSAYGDPQLDALEAEALAGSPDLAAAAARLRQADSITERQRAVGLPQLSGEVSSQTTQQSLNEGFPDAFKSFLPAGWHTQSRAALDLQWDLDFFGANRARIAAATSQADAYAADQAAARLELTTAVAAAYAELARLYEDRDALVDALKVRQQTFTLISQRLQNGLETRGAQAQAQAGIPTSQGDLKALDLSIGVQRHAIAALLGDGPDRGLAIARPQAARLRSIGLPADTGIALAGRRPDLAAARLRAEASANRVKAARRDFYPDVTLSGSYGRASLGVDKFFYGDSHVGALGPALTLPIFEEGRLEGAYRGARAEYDEAVALYNRTLANALRDVADAAASQASVSAQLVDAQNSFRASQEAYRVAYLRYQGGLSPYLNVLTAQSTLTDSRRAVADLQGQAFAQDVALVRALGGGYVSPVAASPSKIASAAR
ncbi:MAG: efflux transporter outer membrane subunit [Caulobacteraceae bacterium]|nr:efflux transporter outer membrane subunit [Caulobacter sp.]